MKFLLTLLISIFFLALTYASAPEEFRRIDLVIIIGLMVFVAGLEVLIARLFLPRKYLQNIVLGGFSAVNILAINLFMNDSFIGLPGYGQVLLLLLAIFVFTTFMNMLDGDARLARVVQVFFFLATAGVILRTFLHVEEPYDRVSSVQGMTSAKNIRNVDFKSRPNVYFIGFDSLIPKVLLKKHMGLEAAPYHEVLDAHFRRFKNYFANRTPTLPSLNSLLALDLGHYSWAIENNVQNHFFPGLIASPLFEIFKHNGYETNTLYRSLYLGVKKGPHVDNYFVERSNIRNGVCEFIDTAGLRAFTFMGYCALIKSKVVQPVLMKFSMSSQTSDIDFLIDNMHQGLQKKVPQVFVAYIYSPGHTARTFDKNRSGALEEYRQSYIEASKVTASHFRKIVTFIDRYDPEAIVYVFGDHGPWISRQDSIEEDEVFFVQDRFGVYGGIHPAGRCTDTLFTSDDQGFMTVLQGVHMIISCLSGGEDAFLVEEDYHLPDPVNMDYKRYDKYIYE